MKASSNDSTRRPDKGSNSAGPGGRRDAVRIAEARSQNRIREYYGDPETSRVAAGEIGSAIEPRSPIEMKLAQ